MRRLSIISAKLLIVLIGGAQPVSFVIPEADMNKDSLSQVVVICKEQLNRCGYEVESGFNKQERGYNEIILTQQNSFLKKSVNSRLSSLGPEAFQIVCEKKSVLIYGNSGLAVRNAIFTYLESLGFRYYFPNPVWYIIPTKPDLFKPLNIVSSPSFDHRRIWYGYGTTGSAKADSNYRFWFMANRLGGSMQAVIGHAYDDIVYRNKATFQQHPEWFYPVPVKGTIPANPKFDLANQSLIQFVTKDVLTRLESAKQKHIPVKMISLCPSDGAGTCNTPACQQLGTVTDRVYSLINKVAKQVSQEYPGTWISGMAYSDFSAPPTKKLEPNTFVVIATAFNPTKYSTDELIKEWGKKAGKVGVYDYLGLYVWDFDLPGHGQASLVDKVTANIKRYHRLGAKGYDAESTPGSINKGLGHYIISRLLWDIKSNVQSIKEEFFQNCFGKASSLMAALWNDWENYPYDAVRETDLATWMDMVQEAGKIERDKSVMMRLAQVKSYLHYLYLYDKFKKSKTENDLVILLTYCYNTTEMAAVSGYPALWVLGNTSSFSGFTINDSKAKYKKDNRQINDPAWFNELIEADRKTLQKKDKIPTINTARQLKTVSMPLPDIFNEKKYSIFKASSTVFTGPHYFVCRIKTPGDKNFISFSGGIVTGGGSAMPITISVTTYTGNLNANSKLLFQFDYTGTRDTQRVSLKRLPPGDYLVKVNDPSKMFRISFSPSVPYSLIITPQQRFNGYTRYMGFYVPKGTAKFRVFKEIVAVIVSPAGRVIDKSDKRSEEFDIDVMPGESGLWLINFTNGHFHIEGIPPYFSMNPEQMLIPG